MAGLWHDVSYSVRRLSRRRGFTAVAVATLALGIGSATALFGVAWAVILRPLPYRDPDRLALVWQSDPRRGQPFVELSYPALRDWREHSRVFEDLAGLSSTNQSFVLTADGEPVDVVGRLVTWNFFSVLGVPPRRGRVLAPDDDRLGAAAVVVLGDRLWREQFGSDPAIVGRRVVLERNAFTVVGVMPPGFAFPTGADLWLPLAPAVGEVTENAGVNWMVGLGRLRPGFSFEQVRHDLDASADRRRRGAGEALGGAAVLTPLSDAVFGPARPVLLALLAAVGLLLLVACANLSALQLVQTSRRATELTVRAALGASVARLARGLLVESAVLAVAGGAAGLLMAWLALPALVALSPQDLPRLAAVSFDARMAIFGVVATLAAALLGALAPMLWLRRGSRYPLAHTVVPSASRTRTVLVVSQVAAALLLTAGAGLLARSLVQLQRVPLGYDADRLLAVDAGLPEDRYDLPHERAYYQELIATVAALPGVESAAAVTLRPLWGEVGMDWPFVVEGQSETEAARNPLLNLETVSPDYFRTMGIGLRRGRGFDERDRTGQPGVAVVSETLARRCWPGQDPIGKRLKIPLPPTEYHNAWLRVVGVVGDARYRELTASRLDLYLSYRQSDHRLQHLLVRTHNPAALAPAVRRVVRSLAPDRPAPGVLRMSDAVSAVLAGPRFAARVFSAFAAAAALLAVLGLYGVVASSVVQRTREIGVRMSLGAQPADIARLVLRQGLTLASAGALVGLAAVIVGSRLLSSLLFEVRPTDAATLAGATAAILLAAALACLPPALRAAGVEPAVALRHE